MTQTDLKTYVSESIVVDLRFPPGHSELFMCLHELTTRKIFSVQLERERVPAPRHCPRHPAPLAASCHSWQPAVNNFIIFPSASCFCRDKFIFGSSPFSPIDRADKTGAWSSDKWLLRVRWYGCHHPLSWHFVMLSDIPMPFCTSRIMWNAFGRNVHPKLILCNQVNNSNNNNKNSILLLYFISKSSRIHW